MSFSESIRISGAIIQAYLICPRQAWHLGRSVIADQSDENLTLGRLVDQNSYAREKHQVAFGDNKIDFLKGKGDKLVISEVKKSSRAENASRLQLAHYLYELRKEGIEATGELLYPKEKKRTSVVLDEGLIQELERIYAEIQTIADSKYPPELARSKYCPKCAYAEYCWS